MSVSYPGTPSCPKEWSSALHETGHVLVALACGAPVHSAEIKPGGGRGTFLSHWDAGQQPADNVFEAVCRTNPSVSWVINTVACYYAGGLLQMHFIHDGSDLQTSCSGDFEDANTLLDKFCKNEDQREFIRSEALTQATNVISKYSAVAWEIALRLYTWRKLHREQILDAVRDAPGGRELLASTARYRGEQYRPCDRQRPGHEGLQHRDVRRQAARDLAVEGIEPTALNVDWWIRNITMAA